MTLLFSVNFQSYQPSIVQLAGVHSECLFSHLRRSSQRVRRVSDDAVADTSVPNDPSSGAHNSDQVQPFRRYRLLATSSSDVGVTVANKMHT